MIQTVKIEVTAVIEGVTKEERDEAINTLCHDLKCFGGSDHGEFGWFKFDVTEAEVMK